MEFFHKVTRFPFMHTRKVWYGLSAFLIVTSLALAADPRIEFGRGFHRRRGGRDEFPAGAEHRSAAHGADEGRRRERSSPGIRQLAGHLGASAARSEREGRPDRRAYSRDIQQGR